MPTPDNPRHFEMGSLMESRFDPFFKWVSVDSANTTGDVEAPCGFVSLVYVEAGPEIEEYLSEVDPDFDTLGLDTGWYVTLTNEQGLIWAFSFGEGTLAEEHARREFAGSEAAYAAWLDQEEGL